MREKKITSAAKIIHKGLSIMSQINEDSPPSDRFLAEQIDRDIQGILEDCKKEGITPEDINLEMIFLFAPNPCRYVH
jgi:hypothetical protein